MRGLVILLFAPLLALAQADRPVPPPRLSAELRQPKPATVADKPAPAVTLGSLRVVLEETPLADVRKAISPAVLDRSGDASEAMVWLCYTIPGTAAATRLWLMSSGEDDSVFGVSVVRLAPRSRPAKRCPSLPAKFRPVSFDRGLALGMSAAQLTQALGEPSQRVKDWWIYHHESKIFARIQGEEGEFIIFNTAYVRLKGGVVDEIRAYLNSSN